MQKINNICFEKAVDIRNNICCPTYFSIVF